MTEKELMVWLRSGLRKISRRYPPIYEALNNAKVPYTGDNKRKKWLYRCADCQQLFDGKQVAVDHIIPAGTLLSFNDLPSFCANLFCGADGLQTLCKECHDLKSLYERYGYTKEEAIIEKQIIAFKKLKSTEQIKLLTSLSEQSKIALLKNAKERIEYYRQLIKENK